MMIAATPLNELERLTALRSYEVLDTPPELAFDDLARLAAHICGTPIALVSLVDAERQWFKSHYGIDATETPRDIAFCAHAIHQNAVFEVPDASVDARFAGNPLVTSGPEIRFYAGAPLVNRDGLALGTLCVIDSKPHRLDAERTDALAALARQTVTQMELRLHARALQRLIEQRQAAQAERDEMETQLRQAQKLEALGQLAAGLAHEINTPMQFVGDNLHFIRQSFETMCQVVDSGSALGQGRLDAASFETVIAEADVSFLRSRVPRAIDRAVEGIARVTGIVEAMKRFSHSRRDLAEVDINDRLADTLVVAGGEYKSVADVVTDYGLLPPVVAHGSDLNQVFLNLLVNAAHAIEARGDRQRGCITIRTEVGAGEVLIHIGDTGIGIPVAIRERVFEPFFTTKAVGKGTGQGLAIARTIVVDGHHGSLDFATTEGVGTTFTVHLPVDGPPPA